MQTNDMDKDLLIRSMLADAEVRPSRRVWKGVSARLDAETAGAAAVSNASGAFFGSWMKWAGASLALSAAAVAAVLFLNPAAAPDQVDLVTAEPTRMTAMLEVPQPVAETEIAAAIPEEQLVAMSPKARVKAAASPVVDIVSVDEAVEECSEVPAPAQEKEAEPHKSVRNSTRGNMEVNEYADLFDKGERQHIGVPMPALMYAKGAIGGNSSDLAFNNKTAQMAPSLTPSTGISELSESTYGVPFTVGIGIRKYILPRLSLGTGLDYSLLTRTFSGKYTKVSLGGIVEQEESGSVFHSMSYLGIPLNVYFDVISSNKIDFYVYGGGEAEYCISNNYRLYSAPDINYSSPVRKLQYSVGAGIGVEFALSKSLGLYIDPEFKYYFHCNQPKNIRTEKPVMINFNAGLRFKL